LLDASAVRANVSRYVLRPHNFDLVFFEKGLLSIHQDDFSDGFKQVKDLLVAGKRALLERGQVKQVVHSTQDHLVGAHDRLDELSEFIVGGPTEQDPAHADNTLKWQPHFVRDRGRQHLHVLAQLARLMETEDFGVVLQDQDVALFVVEKELANGGLHDENETSFIIAFLSL